MNAFLSCDSATTVINNFYIQPVNPPQP